MSLPKNLKHLVKLSSAADQLKVSRQTIYKWVRDGMEVVKIDGVSFTTRQMVNAYLAKRDSNKRIRWTT